MDMQSKQIVHNFIARLELTVGWLELDRLVTCAVEPFPNNKSCVWRSRLWKASRGHERPISVLAHNCLKLARKGQSVVVSVPHIQEAKDIVRNAMSVYHRPVFA